MAFAGLAAIMGGDGFAASEAKLPGIIMALGGAMGFALGTVLAKKLPIKLPPIPGAAWQIGLGCLSGGARRPPDRDHAFERGDAARLVAAVLFNRGPVLRRLCLWFAALARLPASVAAIGTMAVPVIGIVASAVGLHEPLGARPDRGAVLYTCGSRAGGALTLLAASPPSASRTIWASSGLR